VQEFELALNAHEDFADLRHDYGQSLLRLGREGEALRQMEQAVTLAPDCSLCRRDLGQMYRRKAEQLQARAGDLMQTNMASPEGRADLVESWRLLRRAINEYEHAEQVDPSDATILYDLAFLHEEAGDDAAFRQNLARFVERARNKPELAQGLQRAEQLLRETGVAPRGAADRR